MAAVGGYILCATPRSGTTLLCGLLRQTRVAGHPESYFRAVSRDAYCQQFGIEPQVDTSSVAFNRAYLDGALEAGRADSVMFGLRLMQENLSDMSACLRVLHPELPDDPARLRHELGDVAYIHVTRKDVVAQAVSLVKAQQTGLWHRKADGTDLEQIGAPQKPTYDFEALHREVRTYQDYNAAWDTWFDAHGIHPHRVTYEALSGDPLGELSAILAVLGIEQHHAHGVVPTVSKLADTVSAAWAARYQADCA